MSIRILHVVDTLSIGGLQNGLANLIERMDPARFEHVVCALRPVLAKNRHQRLVEAAPNRCLRDSGGFSIQVPSLMRTIREVKPDIVHTRNWGAFEGVFAARLAGGCAVVHSEHGVDSDSAIKEPWRRIAFRRLAFGLADRVLAVSCQLRDLHAQRTGFPARKIDVIYNGVDSRRFSPDPASRSAIRRELGISDAEFCIGCVGNLIPVKDYRTVLQSVALLSEQCRNWRLLILGDGPELSALRGFADAQPWGDRVSFVGASNRVPEMLNAMDIYVVSSITEGISNSALEAMATGLPPVVTDTGGNPEVVITGECGLLFPVGDANQLCEHLRALMEQPEFRMKLARQALIRARKNFSVDAMVQKYERIYQALAEGGREPLRAAARA